MKKVRDRGRADGGVESVPSKNTDPNTRDQMFARVHSENFR